MFRPDLFYLEGNFEQSSCLAVNSNTNLTVNGNFRTQGDTCYLTWSSEDIMKHSYISYKTNYNYSNVVLKFNASYGNTVINYNDVNTPQILRVTTTTNVVYEVYLGFCSTVSSTSIESTWTGKDIELGNSWIAWNSVQLNWKNGTNSGTAKENTDFTVDYINGVITPTSTSGIPTSATITVKFNYSNFQQFIIDFSNLNSGFMPTASISIDTTEIQQIAFPITPVGYTGNMIAFGEEVGYWINYANIISTGGFLNYENVDLPINKYNIVENYDNIYNLCPTRVVREMKKLGYAGIVNLYIGSSHYYCKNATKGAVISSSSDMVLQTYSPLTGAFYTWFQSYCSCLLENGIQDLLLGFSLENLQMPDEWKQKYSDGTYAQGIIDSNSYLFSPSPNQPIRAYIGGVGAELLNEAFSIGINTSIQMIGNIFGTRENNSNYEMAMYDSFTTSWYKYQNKVESMPVYNSLPSGTNLSTEDLALAQWLNKQLQDYSIFMKNIGVNSDVKYSVLFSLPQNVDKSLPQFIQLVNAPYEAWENNQIQYFGIEDFEWVIDSDAQHNEISDFGIEKVHKPLGEQQYFAGKINNPKSANVQWNLIYKACTNAQKLGFANVFICNGEDIRTYGLSVSVDIEPDSRGLRQLRVFNNNTVEYKLTLLKNSGEKIINLGNSLVDSITVGINQVYELTFTVPYYYTDDINLSIVKNEEYDLVKEKQVVQVNGVDKFIIQNIVENEGEGGGSVSSIAGNGGDGTTATTKTVTAYSLEKQLNKRSISFPQTTAQLNADSVNTSAGYLDMVDQACSWRMNYVDQNARIEHFNGGTDNKYRQLSATSTFVYPFLTSTLASLFNIITIFNSYNKTYDIYDADTYGTQRNIIMSLDNIVTDFQKTTDIENIITRLHATGENNLVFTQVNPLGTDYIDDMTYYRNSTYMSQDLLNALDRYDKVTAQLFQQFTSLRTTLSNQQEDVDNLNEQIDTLKSNQITYEQEQSALLKTLSSYPNGNLTISANLKQLSSQISSNNATLQSTQAQLTTATNSLNSTMSQLQAIANQYDMSNTTDWGGLIFTPELLDEYDNFILEDTYNNTSCTTPEQLYQQTQLQIVKLNTPTYTFSLTVDDFLESLPFNEEEKMNITLGLGDSIRAKNKSMNYDGYVRFVGYTVSPTTAEQQGTLQLTFSTTNTNNSSINSLGNTMSQIISTTHEVDINKYYWNMSKGTADWVQQFSTNSLNLVAQAIAGKTEVNEININENGIYLADATNTQEQLALTNNIIAMTTDGWETAEVAITPQWINGKLICANSIATESLTVEVQQQITTATDGVATLSQKLTDAQGELESQISEKIGTTEMWAELTQNSTELNSVIVKTTALEEMSSQIGQNYDSITEKVSKGDMSTEITENATSVIMAWNSGSSSITFEDGEITCSGSNGGKVIISGNGGITYNKNGQTSGFGVCSFVGQTKLQNGSWGTVTLPSCFQNCTMGTDFQVTAWAGNIDSNYDEVFNHDALRNIFVNIGSYDSSTGQLSVQPCIQKIGIQTLTMWGWDSQTTTAGNKQQEGMINVIIYAVLSTSPTENSE